MKKSRTVVVSQRKATRKLTAQNPVVKIREQAIEESPCKKQEHSIQLLDVSDVRGSRSAKAISESSPDQSESVSAISETDAKHHTEVSGPNIGINLLIEERVGAAASPAVINLTKGAMSQTVIKMAMNNSRSR